MLNEIKDFALTIDLFLALETVTFGENSMELRDGIFIFNEDHHGILVRYNLNFSVRKIAFHPESKVSLNCSIVNERSPTVD